MAIFLSTQVKRGTKWSDLQKLQNVDIPISFDESLGFIWLRGLLSRGGRREDNDLFYKGLWEWCGGSLFGLSTCSLESLLGYPGIRLREVELICLSMALVRLRLEEEVSLVGIRNSSSAMQILQPKFFAATTERFYCLYLNRANRVMRTELVSMGGISSTVVDIRVIMKRALELGASGILVSHNHPSGNLTPSDEDIDLTQRIRKAGDSLDIRLIDHLIVFENQYYSMADEGRI